MTIKTYTVEQIELVAKNVGENHLRIFYAGIAAALLASNQKVLNCDMDTEAGIMLYKTLELLLLVYGS